MIKYSSETYLKDVIKHSIKIFVNNELNYYIVVKKIKKIKQPFILNEDGKDITILNNNYYILEYIPKNEKYICRIFIDDKSKIIEKIFLFSKENSFDNGIPTYNDLKICQIVIDNKWKIYNEDVFKNMYFSNEIDKSTYDDIISRLNNVKEIILPFNYIEYLF